MQYKSKHKSQIFNQQFENITSLRYKWDLYAQLGTKVLRNADQSQSAIDGRFIIINNDSFRACDNQY